MDFYPEQHFNCHCCEYGCCDRFAIPVSEKEARELLRLHVPGTPERFEECFSPSETPGEFHLLKNSEGHCHFAEGNLCKIHKLHGLAAKPLACRIFPYHLQHWADGRISAELRFICPSVGCSDGVRTADEQKELLILARQLGGRRGVNNCVYSQANPAPLGTVRTVHEAFRQLLHNEEIPRKLRLYAAARILDFHVRRDMHGAIREADEHFSADMQNFANVARPELEKELGAGRIDALIRARFRNLVCGYLRDDNPNDRTLGNRLHRAFLHYRTYSGIGKMNELNPEAPALSMRYLPEIARKIPLEPGAVEIFQEFHYGKLDPMHFCGNRIHDFDYQTGLRHWLLAAPVAFQLAGCYAIAAGRNSVDRATMHKTVRLLDFTFGRSPFFRLRASRSWINHLASPKSYAALL